MKKNKGMIVSSLLVVLALSMFQGCEQQNPYLSISSKLEYSRYFDSKVFQKLFEFKDKSEVLSAIRSAGRIQDPKSRDMLLSLLNNKDTDVIRASIFALGQIPADSLSERKLITLGFSQHDFSINEEISKALGKMGTSLSQDYLLMELKSPQWKNREAAAIATGLIYRRKNEILQRTLPQIINIISSNDSASWAGAYSLFQTAIPAYILESGQSLPKVNEDTQVYLLRAVRKMLSRLADEGLIKELGEKTYRSLVALAQKKVIWDNIALMKQSKNWRVRLEYTKVMGKINPTEHLDELIEMSRDIQFHVRIAAFEGLGAIENNFRVKKIISEGVNDRDANIAAVNIGNYALQNKNSALDSLKRWSQYGPVQKRTAAIRALSILDGPAVYSFLTELCKAKNKLIQIEAYNTLGEMKLKKSEVFIAGLDSDNPAVISICALSLSNVGDNSSVPVLYNTFKRINNAATIETAQDVLNSLLKLNPGFPSTQLEEMADEDIPQTYNIISRHLAKRGITLPRVDFAMGMKIYEIDTDNLPRKATIITNRGEMVVQLFPQSAPQNVANFYTLAKSGFYKGLTFHRVVSDFVIQGGDPDGTGWGGPGFSVVDEYSDRPFERGSVGIATAGKDTGGSQFFICHSRQPHLDGRYTLFGKLIKGYDILDEIEREDRIINIIM